MPHVVAAPACPEPAQCYRTPLDYFVRYTAEKLFIRPFTVPQLPSLGLEIQWPPRGIRRFKFLSAQDRNGRNLYPDQPLLERNRIAQWRRRDAHRARPHRGDLCRVQAARADDLGWVLLHGGDARTNHPFTLVADEPPAGDRAAFTTLEGISVDCGRRLCCMRDWPAALLPRRRRCRATNADAADVHDDDDHRDDVARSGVGLLARLSGYVKSRSEEHTY